MTIDWKGVATDVVRAGAIVAAVLAVVSNTWSAAHLPPADLVYISAAVGVLNAIVGLVKPYATETVGVLLGRGR